MIRIMSEAEAQERGERVRALRSSTRRADNIAAILMDANVGNHGLHEEAAQVKAQAITKFLFLDEGSQTSTRTKP